MKDFCFLGRNAKPKKCHARRTLWYTCEEIFVNLHAMLALCLNGVTKFETLALLPLPATKPVCANVVYNYQGGDITVQSSAAMNIVIEHKLIMDCYTVNYSLTD